MCVYFLGHDFIQHLQMQNTFKTANKDRYDSLNYHACISNRITDIRRIRILAKTIAEELSNEFFSLQIMHIFDMKSLDNIKIR